MKTAFDKKVRRFWKSLDESDREAVRTGVLRFDQVEFDEAQLELFFDIMLDLWCEGKSERQIGRSIATMLEDCMQKQ